MPLVKRAISPVDVSLNRLPTGIRSNELQCVANGTLANLLRQMSSLSKHAEDIFGELVLEAMKIEHKANNLCSRIERLSLKVTHLDSSAEEVSLQELHLRKPFKSNSPTDQQSLNRHTLPAALQERYSHCEPPPDLERLNPYRDDGRNALKYYTDPDYFFELWAQQMLANTETGNAKKRSNSKTRIPGEKRRTKQLKQPADHRKKYVEQALRVGEHIEEVPPEYVSTQFLRQNSAASTNQQRSYQSQNMAPPLGMHRPESLDLTHQNSGGSSGYGSMTGVNATLKNNNCSGIVLDQHQNYGSYANSSNYASQSQMSTMSTNINVNSVPRTNHTMPLMPMSSNLSAVYSHSSGGGMADVAMPSRPQPNSSIGQYMPGLYSMQSHNTSANTTGYNSSAMSAGDTPNSSRSQTLTPDDHQLLSSPSDSMDSRGRGAAKFRPSQPPPAPPPPPAFNGSNNKSTPASKNGLPYRQNSNATNGFSYGASDHHHYIDDSDDNLPPPPSPPLGTSDVVIMPQFQDLSISAAALPPPPLTFLMSDSVASFTDGGVSQNEQVLSTSPDLPPPPLPNSVSFSASPQKKSPSPPKGIAIGSPMKKPGAPPPPPPPPPAPGIAPPAPSMKNGFERSASKQDTSAKQATKQSQVKDDGEDARSDLLKSIRQGIQLRKVEERQEKERVEAATTVTAAMRGHDVASILARRVVLANSDTESDSASDENEWDDE